MNQILSLDSIEERLSRALRLIRFSQGSGSLLNSRQLEIEVKNILKRGVERLVVAPAFRDVENWVEVYWDPERRTQPPVSTVSTGDQWGNQGEVQLDALTATCKLLLAAAGHGTETVAKYAMEFANHGMIEVRHLFLLKGPPVSKAKPLDRYCTLLNYREALQKVNTGPSAKDLGLTRYWPPDGTDNVCFLEAIGFERRSLMADKFERRASRLLQCGPQTLALILGLVWGTGFRLFGGLHGVDASVAATLPFFHTTSSRGSNISQTLLTLPGFRWGSSNRPLNCVELMELIGKYANLPKQTQRVLNLALRRLRDSTERIELDDKVIDMCIALEALFKKEGEDWKQKKRISRRGSWHFADSHTEREQIRTLLKEFYAYRSDIVHGKIPVKRNPEESDQRVKQLAEIENVVRASLKTMISEGRPQNWEESKVLKSIRHNPPRAETEIPSVKSESLSWSVKEQKEIDRVLEAVWKPEVDNTPPPQPDAEAVIHRGINAEKIKRCQQQGIPYVICVPIRLYMAHPKWPKKEGDPVDDRTKYYCQQDVEKHLRRWQTAASDKKIYQFLLDSEDPTMYLPKAFGMWKKILQHGGITITGKTL